MNEKLKKITEMYLALCKMQKKEPKSLIKGGKILGIPMYCPKCMGKESFDTDTTKSVSFNFSDKSIHCDECGEYFYPEEIINKIYDLFLETSDKVEGLIILLLYLNIK